MNVKSSFLVDVDDGEKVFVITTEINNEEDVLDELYELVEGYLRSIEMTYTYFNLIDIRELDEVEL